METIRLDLDWIDPDPFRESPRSCVIVGKTIDVMVERVRGGRREDARLPQRAAEKVLALPGALDQRRGARENGTRGAAEAFRKADGDRIGEARPLRRRETRGNRCVEETCAVEVHRSAALARGIDRGAILVHRPHAAAGTAMGVLEHDDPARAKSGSSTAATSSGVTRPAYAGTPRMISPE